MKLRVDTLDEATAIKNDRSEAAKAATRMYDLPRFGNVSLLHMTDCHAQLLPIHFREPDVNLGIGPMAGQVPHLVGDKLLRHFGIRPGTPEAHAFTYLDFVKAAKTYGKVGGFAHLATLVKQLKASRPGALLLDGGDRRLRSRLRERGRREEHGETGDEAFHPAFRNGFRNGIMRVSTSSRLKRWCFRAAAT